MIPKRIFYVWLGDKKTPLANICIENWREKLPDFEIIEINENSPYFDFEKEYNTCRWFKEIYDRKIWAYASDYIRCKTLYDHGGIYLDTDITIYKDFTPLLKNNFFIGYEKEGLISAANFGTVAHHPLLYDVLNFYHNEIFNSPLYVITHIFTELIEKNNYSDVKVYDKEYFYPFYGDEIFTPKCITSNTYAVHWWNSSWRSEKDIYFLDNKHKIPLELMDENYKRYKRISDLVKAQRAKNGLS